MHASSYEGLGAIFGLPFMFLGVLVAAICWAVASGSHRAASASFVVAVLNACAISLVGMLSAGDLLVFGGEVFTGWAAGFRVLMLLLVLSAWAFALYAPFWVLKYHEVHRKEKTLEFLDEPIAGDEDEE